MVTNGSTLNNGASPSSALSSAAVSSAALTKAAAAAAAPSVRFDHGSSRFYEQRYPKQEDLVMVKVTRSADMGVYVNLLEYNNIEGMILMSELSKRRIRSVKKVVKIGRHEVALVLRVDKEKGYIDLSKKRVSVEDSAKCEDRFSKSKKVYQIICHMSQKFRIKSEDLNKQIAWPLYSKYGHALDAFTNPDFSSSIIQTLNLSAEIAEALLTDISLRLASTAMRIRAHVDVWCHGFDGVDAVKAALAKGREVAAAGVSEPDVKVKLIAPPLYTIILGCSGFSDGDRRLKEAIKAIEQTVRGFKGGDAKQQGEFLILGGDEERPTDGVGSSSSSDESSFEEDSEEEEEDEGMGRIEDVELPEGKNLENEEEEEDDKSSGG